MAVARQPAFRTNDRERLMHDQGAKMPCISARAAKSAASGAATAQVDDRVIHHRQAFFDPISIWTLGKVLDGGACDAFADGTEPVKEIALTLRAFHKALTDSEPATHDQVNKPLGCLGANDLGQSTRGCRRRIRRFPDNRIAIAQRRRDLPRRRGRWEVPGRDDADHATASRRTSISMPSRTLSACRPFGAAIQPRSR